MMLQMAWAWNRMVCCVLSEHVYRRVRSYGYANTVTCHSVWYFCIVPRYDTDSKMPILNLTKNKGVRELSVREVRVFNPYQRPSCHHFDSQQIMEPQYVTVRTASPFG